MARKIKVKISWKKTSPLPMASTAHGVAKAIKANTIKFPTPAVPDVDLDASATAVEKLYPSRKDGTVARDAFNTAVDDLDLKLHQEAEYVTKIANGDETVIHLAAFESTKSKNGSVLKPIETNAPRLESMPNGTVKSIVNAVDEADNYTHVLQIEGTDFEVTVSNNQIEIPVGTHVIIIPHATRSATFTDLPPMKKVFVAVIANNSAGSSDLSPISSTSTIL